MPPCLPSCYTLRSYLCPCGLKKQYNQNKLHVLCVILVIRDVHVNKYCLILRYKLHSDLINCAWFFSFANLVYVCLFKTYGVHEHRNEAALLLNRHFKKDFPLIKMLKGDKYFCTFMVKEGGVMTGWGYLNHVAAMTVLLQRDKPWSPSCTLPLKSSNDSHPHWSCLVSGLRFKMS